MHTIFFCFNIKKTYEKSNDHKNLKKYDWNKFKLKQN